MLVARAYVRDVQMRRASKIRQRRSLQFFSSLFIVLSVGLPLPLGLSNTQLVQLIMALGHGDSEMALKISK